MVVPLEAVLHSRPLKHNILLAQNKHVHLLTLLSPDKQGTPAPGRLPIQPWKWVNCFSHLYGRWWQEMPASQAREERFNLSQLGNLDTQGSKVLHHPLQAQSKKIGSATLDPSLGTPNQGTVRHCHGSGLYKSLGGSQSGGLERSKSDLFLGENCPASILEVDNRKADYRSCYYLNHPFIPTSSISYIRNGGL